MIFCPFMTMDGYMTIVVKLWFFRGAERSFALTIVIQHDSDRGFLRGRIPPTRVRALRVTGHIWNCLHLPVSPGRASADNAPLTPNSQR